MIKSAVKEKAENTFANTLKAQIKSRIDALGINIRAFERKAGLNVGAVNNILHGLSANPTAETLNAIANAFKCSVDELLGRETYYLDSENLKFTELQNFKWNPNLFISIIEELNKQLDVKGITLNCEQSFSIIYEIFLYSLKKEKTIVDASLVDWLLEKSI